MNKVKTLDDLRKMRETLRSTLDIREKSNHPEQMVQIRISMATINSDTSKSYHVHSCSSRIKSANIVSTTHFSALS